MTTQSTATGTIRRAPTGLALRAPAVRIAKGHAGSEFLAAYPDYVTTARLDKLRAAEYPYLDSRGHVYLDYAGAGLAADAQLRAHVGRMRGGCFGNPHSENPASRRVHRADRAGPGCGSALLQRLGGRVRGHLHPERDGRVPPGRRGVPVLASVPPRADRG